MRTRLAKGWNAKRGFPYEVYAHHEDDARARWWVCAGWVDLHRTFKGRLDFKPSPEEEQ